MPVQASKEVGTHGREERRQRHGSAASDQLTLPWHHTFPCNILGTEQICTSSYIKFRGMMNLIGTISLAGAQWRAESTL